MLRHLSTHVNVFRRYKTIFAREIENQYVNSLVRNLTNHRQIFDNTKVKIHVEAVGPGYAIWYNLKEIDYIYIGERDNNMTNLLLESMQHRFHVKNDKLKFNIYHSGILEEKRINLQPDITFQQGNNISYLRRLAEIGQLLNDDIVIENNKLQVMDMNLSFYIKNIEIQ